MVEPRRRALGRRARCRPATLAGDGLLHGLIAALAGRDEAAAVGEAACGFLRAVLGLECCSVLLRDSDSAALTQLAMATGEVAASTRLQARLVASGLADEAARSLAPVLVSFSGSAAAGDAFSACGDGEAGGPSQLCLPLTSRARALGVLFLVHPGAGAFGPDLVAELGAATQLVAQVLALVAARDRLRQDNRRLVADARHRLVEVEESQRHLAQREKLATIGEMISGVAHELNNRLVPIIGYAEVLAGSDLSQEDARRVSAIGVSATGVRAIVESLLGFSRQRKPLRVSTDLNALVARVAAVARLATEREGIVLSTRLAHDLPLTLADALQIEQVILNLVRNAQDAIRARPELATGIVVVATERQDDRVVLSVRDNGIGIPQDHLPRIMDPFFTTKAAEQGTGLGLSVCYGIMSEHLGDIQVASRPGDTVFTLSFPALAGGLVEQAAPVAADQLAPPACDGQRARVLVVDDEESILELLHDVLADSYDVDVAASGFEALRRLEEVRYDLVISDMRMPGLGGRDVYEWLRRNRPGDEERFIFTTGDTFDPEATAFLRQSKNCCLPKPFGVRQLREAVHMALAAGDRQLVSG